jgi:hypothetical protein
MPAAPGETSQGSPAGEEKLKTGKADELHSGDPRGRRYDIHTISNPTNAASTETVVTRLPINVRHVRVYKQTPVS